MNTPDDVFVTTRWTVVLAAGRGGDAESARAALGELCQTYWYPLYAYVRRRGYAPHDAEDRVQGFFARLIRLNSLAALSRGEGRFRAFLLASLKHYLADEWDRDSAGKRDARRTVSWDALEADARYAAEPADRLSPERLYERQWALALLESVFRRLRDETAAEGKAEQFALLQSAVTGGSPDYGASATGRCCARPSPRPSTAPRTSTRNWPTFGAYWRSSARFSLSFRRTSPYLFQHETLAPAFPNVRIPSAAHRPDRPHV